MHPNRTNAPKLQFRVLWGGSGAFIGKIPTRLRGTNFCTSSAQFAPSFIREPNSPECTQIVRTHQNVSVGSNGVDRVCSLRKIQNRLHGTNFCTSSGRFAPSFVRQPNSAENVSLGSNGGGSGAFVAKYSDATLWHELSHYFGPLCTEIRKVTKRSRMHPNSTKRTKMSF